MIRNTFLFLDGISEITEFKLWNQGIKDWNDFLKSEIIPGISKKRKKLYNIQLIKASQALLGDNITFFTSKLPRKFHYRLYEYFKDSCLFIDIETSSVNGYITCMTLYDGNEIMTFVKDYNLDFSLIRKIIMRFKMIVTFNGAVFDLPFLRKYCKNLIPNILFWDLRYSCAKLKLVGGLKLIEAKLGIKRKNLIVERLHGGDPIKLWRTFKATGDRYFLDLLVEYNQEDSINLQFIADKIYPRLTRLVLDSN